VMRRGGSSFMRISWVHAKLLHKREGFVESEEAISPE
jgi:hypothetical protein